MKITVYKKTASVCRPCDATVRKLDLLGLEYVAVSADETPGVADELRGQGWTESPVVEVYDASGALVRSWSGYRPDHLEAVARDAA